MILIFLIYPQQGLSNSTGRVMMHFLLLPSCARITVPVQFSRLQGIISAEIYVRQYLHMKNILDLLLDFNKIFSHSTPRINR